MAININSLKTQLAAKIAAINTNTDAEDLLLLSASVSSVTEDRIIAVENIDDLPILRSGTAQSPQFLFPSGSIFYIKSLNILVISSNNRWIGIDGRVARKDGVDSVAYAWGRDDGGRLGTGNTTNTSSPVTVAGGITNWSQVAASRYHSLGLTSTGIAYAWGRNTSGQSGDNTITNKSIPTAVVGDITNWSQVSAGQAHSLGVTSTGILYAWGYNSSGQLGTGNTTSALSPVTVAGGITNWSQVSAGRSHSLGLTSTGILYAWGYNSTGQLGTGNTTNTSSPVTAVGGITSWRQVAGGR